MSITMAKKHLIEKYHYWQTSWILNSGRNWLYYVWSIELCDSEIWTLRKLEQIMEPAGSMPNSQGPSNNPILILINPIDIYFFKIHSNIVLPSTPWPS